MEYDQDRTGVFIGGHHYKLYQDKKGTYIIRNCKREYLAENDPTFLKDRPYYCCSCGKDTGGLSDCHVCGHMKGRWKTDTHHCLPNITLTPVKSEAGR